MAAADIPERLLSIETVSRPYTSEVSSVVGIMVPRLGAALMALAVVRISLEHWPARIGILIVLRVRAGDVVHVSYEDRRIRFTVVDV